MEKLKRGDTREDGMVFWAYDKYKSNGQRWIAENLFHKKIEKNKEAQKNKLKKQKIFSAGYVREDGMVFLRYNKMAKNGEVWISKDEFEKRKAIRRKILNDRYSNDKEFKNKLKKYAIRNRQKIRERMKFYLRDRRKKDILFKLSLNIRALIRDSFKNKNIKKKTKSEKILGCSICDFKKHIESNFQLGMSWENRSEWHIDHIMPVCLAKNELHLIRLNHYSNLRPLYATENLKKSGKYSGEIPQWLKV